MYGICVEKITLGDLNPMSAELVAKYGGTLVSDIVESDIDDFYWGVQHRHFVYGK